MRRTLIATIALLALHGFSSAHASGMQDAAFDKNARAVRDARGNCVHTKWTGGMENCGQNRMSAVDLTQEQRTVYFDFNSAVISASERTKLDQLATIINSSNEVSGVRIHGFTDQMGTSSYNNGLATKRAAAVKKYLDKQSRLRSSADVRGIGKSEPVEQCASMETRDEKIACMSGERRVEVELMVKN